jgi:hypothetical protein
MYNIKYLLVNDAGSKSRACNSRHRFIPHIGHCLVVEAPGFPDGFMVQGSWFNEQLFDELIRLRRHWPNAKILGVSELDISASHAPVRVNPDMNQLRSLLSALP